ncbi:MAG: peptidylprolyl isomerase [Bryobacterales bacterium]|nr:peptidylprolyl isomerase [Bryobacterales bacterium]
MKTARILLFGLSLATALASFAQPAPVSAPVDEDAVVATLDGRPVTVREVRAFLNTMPQQNRGAALQNAEDFIRQYALMSKLARVAEEHNLDQESPFREQIEYNRRMILSTAGLNRLSQEVLVTDDETRSFYDAHVDDYTKVRVKVIYLPFLNTPPKEGETRVSLTESEALTLAQQLVKDIRAGADFVELVKKHSKDEGSAKRDGDFATFSRRDNIPADVKSAVFVLEQGAVSDPVRQANGFYIFRIEEKIVQPYTEVAGSINDRVHDEKFRKVMDNLRDSIDIQGLKPELLKP